MDDQRNAQLVDRPLPPHQARPHHRLPRRRHPDQQLLLGELSHQVQTALTKLSPELREAVILRDLQQLDYNEIRQVLDVPEGTVKSRINRGRIELARILQQMGVRPS